MISTDTEQTGGTNPDTPTTVKAWEDYINSHGGIAGHPVQVIEKDDQGNPAISLQDFQELQQDGVIVIGDATIETDTAWQKAADDANIPVVGMGPGGIWPPYQTDPNFFSPSATLAEASTTTGEAAKLGGYKQIGILYCAELPNCAKEAKLGGDGASQEGVTMVYSGPFSSSSPNYTAQCLAAKDAGVQALQIGGISPQAELRIISDCAKQGWNPPELLSGALVGLPAVTTSVQHGVGFTGNLPWFVRNTTTAPFHQAMDSYLPHAELIANLTGLWAGLETVAAAFEADPSGTPTTQNIYNGLYTFKSNTVGGWTPPLTYVQGQAHQVCGEFYFQLDSGTYSMPWGNNAICVTGQT